MARPPSAERPILLDLFCGAGGTAMGYSQAGFEVVGVDIRPQPHYPFEFIQADALEFMATADLSWFEAIHASPPCQDHMMTPHPLHGTGWLLGATRDLLLAQPWPWVIENVPGAAAHGEMRADFRVCGCMFDLKLRRERCFETSWEGFDLRRPCLHLEPVVSVVGHGTPTWVREKLGFNPTIRHYREAMGIDWMNRDELSQAIPPAYTRYIGAFLYREVQARRGVTA